ncbi:DEAD/DEAH box helicase [Kitasatospora sp. NBC_01266]|uniref:DEAD/DEAH box helicase n=1 Tax=Kitasatospora sp. NBC_01266 TaxID=2903572 RepID=UPI002E31F770|nr:DEAD/DEAH box helicase [Kitasatospora sp. NBC_01266]
MSGVSNVSTQVLKIVALVREAARGITQAELTALAGVRHPRLPEIRLMQLVERAVAAELLQITDGWITAVDSPAVPESTAGVVEAASEATTERCGTRFAAVDLESVVRTTAMEPYLERHVYQIAVARFGSDSEWVAAAPRWDCFVQLSCDQEEIRDPALRKQVRDHGAKPDEAWAGLSAQLASADAVVAYNGTGLDFPLIREASIRAGLDDPLASCALVDALYLAHVVWPAAESHRLHDLAKEVSVQSRDLRAHTAPDDVALLVRVLACAGHEVASWQANLRSLLADVCAGSPAWRVLLHLAGSESAQDDQAQPWEPHQVSLLLSSELAQHQPRRVPDGQPSGRANVHVPDRLRNHDGVVDPGLLAASVHLTKAEQRPAQQHMGDTLHAWTRAGTSGLLEAPTGTGKSYAVLAAALEWLAGAPDRTAVVATFTKQLQSQMARDLKDLDRAFPGVLTVADLVKGQANRLSLAALTSALVEATRAAPGAASSRRPVGHPRFRELTAYLLLRLRACTHAPLSWTARSVDPVDLPAFFASYAGHALPLWLASLSQRDGDFRPGADTPLAPHADTVREAIAGHRLVLANHALVLSHLDDLRSLGPQILLVIDEAHELENAATSALTAAVDHREVEMLLAEAAAWVNEARAGSARDRAAAALNGLETLLAHERLPHLAAQAFDARAKGVGARIGTRTATLASPFSGTSGTQEARRFDRLLVQHGHAIGQVAATISQYVAEHSATLDALARERARGLTGRADDLANTLARLATDLEALLQPTLTLDDQGGSSRPSRVVFLEELGEPDISPRAYRFRIASSPVDLVDDPEWQRYLQSFDRVHYVSATLRVGGSWDFIRNHLALAASLPALALDSPFDLANQAELVCFSDFPSWAEQEEGAMATVAHQLGGYAEEAVRPRHDGDGHDGGAMVLTTARATAAGIADRLERELRARVLTAPVVGALPLGNGRAVTEFTDRQSGGGFLVGTKGLWQGVDVSDEHRLRLVWINKLPFAPFAAPVIEARRAAVRQRAEESGHPDPDSAATEDYYLPLAALQLRQAVGRLIRSDRHRGVIVISDRKLGGHTALRRAYRRCFLGSLDAGLLKPDPATGEPCGGNVTTMTEGWRRIWGFLARQDLLPAARLEELTTDDALDRQALLPYTRRIRELALTEQETNRLRACGELTEVVLERAAEIGGLLGLSNTPLSLKPAQRAAIQAVTERRNLLGLLPTGFGKSFTFQLPALVLPGTTIVISPLVALMHDQALELNRAIGGAVRALVSPLRESSSRAGKTEVADQLLGRYEHQIKLVYVSPERLCQRRFRELVRQAVRSGRVTRIAVDEAHTVAQWEDFRPSMRRAGRFLAELRSEFGLPVTAVTATANRSVHAAMRESLFGLAPEPPAAGSAQELDEAACADVQGGLVTVRENPIRPELAIFRRSFRQAGPSTVVGLAERVIDALDGHAIFYCLTVKEVNALHAHLREYVGGTGVRVLRFHGRLTEAEKTAVMHEFREAPRQGAEGFAPLVTVATSAFGLGVNRPDVRTVFCVSPPTDLAALYQQIGRAGRDAAGSPAVAALTVNTALALATSRGLRTVRFMTGQDLAASLLRRMGQAVLAEHGSFDAMRLAEALVAADADAGLLTDDEVRQSHTLDRYTSGVMRAFSALADLGTVTDLGDFPPLCTVKPGDFQQWPAVVDEAQAGTVQSGLERRIVAAVLDRPDRARLAVDALDLHLAESINGYREFADGPAGTWEILADLHDRGLLDVSAAPSRRLVTGLCIRQDRLPAGFSALVARRSARVAEELDLLQQFFQDSTTCSQRKFADYFGVPVLPEGCCTAAPCRCSACWSSPDWPVADRRPAVAQAFESASPRTGGGADGVARQRRLDQRAHRLAGVLSQGIHPRTLWHALRGEEASYDPLRRRLVRLPRPLRESPHFGGRADLSFPEVEQCIRRLAEAGAVVPTADGRWQARQAATVGTSTVRPRKVDETA